MLDSATRRLAPPSGKTTVAFWIDEVKQDEEEIRVPQEQWITSHKALQLQVTNYSMKLNREKNRSKLK